ncbi:hypothetical protein KKG41_05725 [Patescibacteria group bacterium]|nr:hypothetical protein [Patescibacteria group bacterium]MBU1890362.1 hypothetical protein [Patescibacteria group bacterium]
MEQKISTKQKTKTITTLTVILGVFAVSAAGFFALSIVSGKDNVSSFSLLTTKIVNAIETDNYFNQGSLATLQPGETATFNREDGGIYTVEFIENVVIKPGSFVCLQAHTFKSHVIYKEYAATSKEPINTQDLTVGPCDIGWAVEVIKALDINGADKTVLTVPN